MAEVEVEVNGRGYRLSCEDGQEEHLRALADELDRRIAGIGGAGSRAGEARLLLAGALILADELHEARDELTRRGQVVEAADAAERTAAQALDATATRLEAIASRLTLPR